MRQSRESEKKGHKHEAITSAKVAHSSDEEIQRKRFSASQVEVEHGDKRHQGSGHSAGG